MNDRAKRFLELIQTGILIGDGALGTELLKITGGQVQSIESLNLDAPSLVGRLHRDYIAAGSRIIETNSFGANRINLSFQRLEKRMPEINRASVALAREAAENADIFVAGSIGPVREIHGPEGEGEGISPEDRNEALVEQAQIIVEAGADLLILETFIDLDELTRLVRAVRGFTDIPIVAQMAFEEGGYTPRGDKGDAVARALIEAGADVTGANCGGGVRAVMSAVDDMRGAGKPISAFLNAGFAEQLEGRKVFTAGDSYLAERAAELVRLGVRVIGGCCGTTPATIRTMTEMLQARRPSPLQAVQAGPPEKAPAAPSTPVAVPEGVLVELAPPKDLQLVTVRSNAMVLVRAGIRHITLSDNPLASVRVGNVAVAGLLRREFGVMPIPHITGRDRNRIALQSEIMAAHCLGIRQLLCVTGDPVRMYHEANTSGVFDVNSVGLVRMVAEFNLGQRLDPENRTSFGIGVAFNPNVRSLEGQMDKLLRKIDAGAHFVMTQPIYTPERLEAALEMFVRRRVEVPLFCGILPLTSSRNAEFLHNEVPGIIIPDEFREALGRFPALADQRKAAADLIVGLVGSCLKINRRFYLITPRDDAGYVLPVIDFLKQEGVPL